MRCRFRDPVVQARFEADGFVVLTLLSPEDVARLSEAYEHIAADRPAPFAATLTGRTFVENEAVAARISAVVEPRLETVLADWSVIGSTYLVKAQHPDGALALHQDWSSVDERRSASLNVWCPLADVPADGGALDVVAGSHLWFTAHRAPLIPSVQVELTAEVLAAATTLPVVAGEAVFYDHRLFHGSRASTRPGTRVVAQLGVVPEDEPLVMCFPTDEGSVELRQVDAGAFFRGLDYEVAPPDERPGSSGERVPLEVVSEGDVLRRIVAGPG